MDKDKKIRMQQTIIDDLQAQVRLLIEENKKLESELQAEREKPKIEREKTIALATDLEKAKNEYVDMVQSLKTTKEAYENKLREVLILKADYKKGMGKVLKSIKRKVNC